ncbi:MAG: PCMD domain-containing protein [Bacteroidales bacterium]|nr:PCMD domain-containing protein [Bacteroidales bacterium]
MKKIFLPLVAIMILGLAGCIDNDIPYPRIQPNFTSFEVEGQNRVAQIDTLNRKVTVYLPDAADIDIYNVKVTEYAITPDDAKVVGDAITTLDLSEPQTIVLSLYQDYDWTIQADYQVDREFQVKGEIGTSTIDPVNHRVLATVPDNLDLSALEVTAMKLGPVGSTQSPDLAGQSVDFTSPVTVEVTSHGHVETWTIYVDVTKANVFTESVDAWTRVIWAYGNAQAGRDNGFEYREATSLDWITVPSDWIEHNGGDFTARIIHMEPASTYVVRAYTKYTDTEGNTITEYGSEIEVTTGVEQQVPNASLDEWWLDGKVWCPWAEGGESYWDTGNKGATTLGSSNSVPTSDTSTGMGQAAMLQTKFVGLGLLGKLAAGNLFAGVYVRTDGTNGVLSFGREFDQRPTKLKAWVKYNTVDIDYAPAAYGYSDLKGQPDTCVVWCALIDSDTPCEIRTNPSNRKLFDEHADDVIAYGRFQSGSNIDNYTQIDVDLNYVSTSRVPRYILIVASASKYGDFFTGGNGSVLYIDDVSLHYDY